MTEIMKAPDAPLAEVKWRVDGKPTEDNTVRYVPYLDASTVARLLDEWVGPDRWQDSYQPAQRKGLWSSLSIRCGDEWVTKTDIGVPSNFEGEKGEVSDAFKRVATIKWGVGRNVYSLPTIWAPCKVDRKGNAWPTDKTVPEILRKLKAAGFEDAATGEATAHHDEPAETMADRHSSDEEPVDAEVVEYATKDQIEEIKTLKKRLPADSSAVETVEAEDGKENWVCGHLILKGGKIVATYDDASAVIDDLIVKTTGPKDPTASAEEVLDGSPF